MSLCRDMILGRLGVSRNCNCHVCVEQLAMYSSASPHLSAMRLRVMSATSVRSMAASTPPPQPATLASASA